MQKVQKGKDVALKVAKLLSKDFINFVNKSPSPHHVVSNYFFLFSYNYQIKCEDIGFVMLCCAINL